MNSQLLIKKSTGKYSYVIEWVVLTFYRSTWPWRWKHCDPSECQELLTQWQYYIPEDSFSATLLWRKLNLETGSFVKCLLYKERSCEKLEFSKNFMSCDQVLINSNMTLLCWIDSLILGVAISETPFILF